MSCLDICALNDPLIEEANPSKILYSLLIPNPKVYVSSTVGGNVDEQEETELKTHFLALETALMWTAAQERDENMMNILCIFFFDLDPFLKNQEVPLSAISYRLPYRISD